MLRLTLLSLVDIKSIFIFSFRRHPQTLIFYPIYPFMLHRISYTLTHSHEFALISVQPNHTHMSKDEMEEENGWRERLEKGKVKEVENGDGQGDEGRRLGGRGEIGEEARGLGGGGQGATGEGSGRGPEGRGWLRIFKNSVFVCHLAVRYTA